MPRVMNVDNNPAYPAAVDALKAEGAIPRRVALRQCKYLNNLIEQDHRTVKKTSLAGQRLRLFSKRVADHTGNRNDAHDPEGPGKMVGKRGCGRPSSLYRRVIRPGRLTAFNN